MMSKEICANCGQLWGHMPYCPQRGNVPTVQERQNYFNTVFSEYSKQPIDYNSLEFEYRNDIEPRDSYY